MTTDLIMRVNWRTATTTTTTTTTCTLLHHELMGSDRDGDDYESLATLVEIAIALFFFFFFFFILRRMGKNKAEACHTSTYFHTRRVSI